MPATNSLLAAAIVGVVAVFLIRTLSSLVPDDPTKKPKNKSGFAKLALKFKFYVILFISLIPGVILSQNLGDDLFGLITFQVGVLFNFYVATLIGVAITTFMLNRDFIKKHPELEDREEVDKQAREAIIFALGGLLLWAVIAGVFGNGGTGIGIALVGAIFGGALGTSLVSSEDDHMDYIERWRSNIEKERERKEAKEATE